MNIFMGGGSNQTTATTTTSTSTSTSTSKYHQNRRYNDTTTSSSPVSTTTFAYASSSPSSPLRRLIPAVLSFMLLVSICHRVTTTTTAATTTRLAFQKFKSFAYTTSSLPAVLERRTRLIVHSPLSLLQQHRTFTTTTTTRRSKLSLFHQRISPNNRLRTMSTVSKPASSAIDTSNGDDTDTNKNNNDTTSSGYGVDMDQNALMETDLLVAVDENDHLIHNVVVTKRMGHTFNTDTPRGILHRAFSLFIFNDNGELLLTQRAGTKITFPNVWTNTVCSHPLHGMTPYNEVDDVLLLDNNNNGTNAYQQNFPAIKYAAIRKCQHELGIPSHCIDHNAIQFISRFHYWAADTITYKTTTATTTTTTTAAGSTNGTTSDYGCPWGEHEIDYVLFLKLLPNTTLPIVPNPEEVSEYKFISLSELRHTMLLDPKLLWSPWFIGILERGGFEWWEHLDLAMSGHYTNDHITYFDPPNQHMAPYNLPLHTKLTGVLEKGKNVNKQPINLNNDK